MFDYKNKYRVAHKAISIVLICLFSIDSVAFADQDTLAPIAGNPKVYQAMRDMMEERFDAHQGPIDEFIRQNASKAKGLSAIPYLEEELVRAVDTCGANKMLTRLKVTLASAGGKIQVIFVKSEDELPVFNGQKVWGHAGTYVTVFALESEKDSREGRRRIIARLLHEIRARSTRAKELFDEEFENNVPTTPEEIIAFVKSMREKFEKDNLRLQQEVEQNYRITTPLLAQEFVNLTFAAHPHVMNRDYAMAKARNNPEAPGGKQSSNIENINGIVSGIKAQLSKIDGKKIRRRGVNENIRNILLRLQRDDKPYFNYKQADKISRIIKLNERLGALRLLFLCQDNGSFVFKSTHSASILRSSRKEEDIKAIINTLRGFGITEGYHLSFILTSSRQEADMKSLVSTLNELGITENSHITTILASSRKNEEIKALIGALKRLGITESIHIALIIASSRKKEEIEAIISTLKGLGITEGYPVSFILTSSRKEEEIRSLIYALKDLGITKNTHFAIILHASRKEEDIKALIGALKELDITEGYHLALILASSRKKEEIEAISITLKGLGITKGTHLALILSSSRKEEEIKALIGALKELDITEGYHLALILASSRKEEEIRALVSTLKGLGITKGYHFAIILHGSRKEEEIRALIGTLKGLGITKGTHLALILSSSRKEENIKTIINTLKGLGITEGTHLALVLASSRKNEEIRAIVNTLKGLGITEGTHLALILSSSRKEENIKTIISALKPLGISEGIHFALILASSRKEEEIKTLINTLKGLDITKGAHLALILSSSRKEEEIKTLINTLKGLDITKGAHLALILSSSRKEEEIRDLVNTLKKFGITEGYHLSLVLASSRKEEEVRAIVRTLEDLGITEGAHLALILHGSRKEEEIKALIGTLKGLGIVEGYHLALILHGSRKREDIKAIVGTLEGLGITEGSHIAPILASFRKEEEIKSLIKTLKGFGITEGAHLALILHGSRKNEEIKRLIKALKELGITEGAHVALILRGARKEGEILSYVKAFMKLRKKAADFNIPSILIAQMIANPEFVTRNFYYMLKEKAGLPPLDRPLRDEDKEYLRFRLLLRQFGLNTVYGLIDIFAEDSGKREEIKKDIRDRIKEENIRLSALLKVKAFSDNDYKEAGLLLFSLDEKIRIAVRDILVERHFDRINRYKDGDKKSLASELLLDVSTRYDIYHNLLAGDLKPSSYIAYLESYLKFIDLILYYRNQPESLRQIRKEFKEFKAQFEIEHDVEFSEDELITEFANKNGYDVEAVLLALGKVHVRSLDKKIGEDATLMDFVPAPLTSYGSIDARLLCLEEQFYEEFPGGNGNGNNGNGGNGNGAHDEEIFTEDEKITVGSLPGVFQHLCDKNITEAFGGVTGQTIANDVGRSYATIDYDLRGLYHLKLIEKSEEDSQKSGKDARWFVPENIKKKQGDIMSILAQFKGEDLRPSTTLLNKVYEEEIKPLLESSKDSSSIMGRDYVAEERSDKPEALSSAQGAAVEAIDDVINEINSQLVKVDGDRIKRRDVNESIKDILLRLYRDDKPYFNNKQADRISRATKLNERLEIFKLLFLCQNKGAFVFKGSHSASILRGSRKEEDIRAIISMLKGLGVTEGYHIALILSSSRKEGNIKGIVSTLKEFGITEGMHIALILHSARKKEDIKTIIEALKGLGITEGSYISPILASSRKEEEIKAIVSTLKGLGITESFQLAFILVSARREGEIKNVVGVLKELDITENIHISSVLHGSRKEEEIKRLVSILKGFDITESHYLSLILRGGRKEEEIKRLVGMLNGLGITEGYHLAIILASSRKEEDIKSIIGTLKELGITESYHMALILRGSRKEEEIRTIVSMLKEFDITKGAHLAIILRGGRKEGDIKALVNTLKGLGITESTHISPILASSRKKEEIKILVSTLNRLGITEGYHLSLVLASSRKEGEIKAIVSTLKGLDITDGYHLAVILHGSRKEREIKAIVSALKELGITKGVHIAFILRGSRKEADIRSSVNAFMKLKKKTADFDIPNFLIARMIANPEFVTGNFSYMLKERAKLPPLDRLLRDEEKEYLRFRLILRQLGLGGTYGLIDMFAENSGKREEIKKDIHDRVKEENARLAELLKIKTFSEDAYKEAGLLLFSCDNNIRTEVRDALAERHFGRVSRYKDDDKKSLASEILLDVSTRHNIYHNLLINELRPSSYTAYLESYLKLIDTMLFYRNQPESLLRIRKEFKKFKIGRNGDAPEEDPIIEFAKEKQYDVGAVLLALGRISVKGLNDKLGEDATLMDFIAAPSVTSYGPIDAQLLCLEEQFYEELPGDNGNGKHEEEAFSEDKKITVGSPAGVFKHLCDNDITEASGGVTGQTIANDVGRSYATIDYDLRGLYHLKLIEKSIEDDQKTGKDVRWYVPEKIRKKQKQAMPILINRFRGKNLRPNTDLLSQVYEKEVKPILEPSAALAQSADIENIDSVINDIRYQLVKVSGNKINRKDVNESIKRALLNLHKDNKPYFSAKQADKISRIRKLSERLETLRLLFLCRNNGVSVFKGANLALILTSSREKEEIRALINTLIDLGITEGYHLALVLNSSRKEEDIKTIVGALKKIGITDSYHLAIVLASSRKEEEINTIGSTLNLLGITEDSHLALILASSRKEEDIKTIVSTLKRLGITGSYHLALILTSSRTEEDIKTITGALKDLGITAGAHIAFILVSSREEGEIKTIVSTLKGLDITEGHHIALILHGARKEEEIKTIIGTLKKFGITEPTHISPVLAGSRKEEEINTLVGTLNLLGIAKGTHIALILAGSRKEDEIKSLIGTLKGLGITEATHLASILSGSRKEEAIKALINTLEKLGITESYHLALILSSSRKEGEIKAIVSTLNSLGITESYHLALILASSRKEGEIKAIVSMLNGLGITEGYHLALTLASARKEEEIRILVGVLKGLGITEGAHLALVLNGSRKEEDIKTIVGALKKFDITEGAHLSLILSSSRKEEEIKALVSTLKGLDITEGHHIALILHGARKEEEIKTLFSALKDLGITESYHLVLVLERSRKELEIKSIVSMLKGLGITESAHLALILSSSRKEEEIKRLTGVLKNLGITEGRHLSIILASSRKEENIKSIIGALKEFGITEGTHIAPILASSRKEGDIKSLISALKGLDITEGAHISLILARSRKEVDALSYVKAFMKLRKKAADFNIPSILIAQMIANPEFVTHNFSYMLKERAGLPPLDRLLKDEDKEYLRFRLLLRQFGLNTVYGLIDIFAEDSGKREEIKKDIRDRIKEENIRLSALLKVKAFSDNDYKEAGLLLFSLDEKIRIAVRDILVERHFDRINRYKDGDKKSLASELLLDVSTRYDIYHNLLAGDLKPSSYIAYLESYLRLVEIILYYRDQPDSLRQIRKKFNKFKIGRNGDRPGEDPIIEFANKNGYDVETVLLALGKVHVRSLEKEIGEDCTLMDFVPAQPIALYNPIDDQMLSFEEDQFYEEFPDSNGNNGNGGNGNGAHDEEIFTEDKKITVGSLPGVFQHLCDKNITEAFGGITGQTIASDVGRSYATIDYDLRGLYHLKLIEKSEEDSQKSGKDARWFVPENIKKKQGDIMSILAQFKGEDLRPSTTLLNKVYEEEIKPLLESSKDSHKDNSNKPAPELIDVLDPATGKPTGIVKTKEQIHIDGDAHASSLILVFDTEGRLLRQKRSARVSTDNGKFDISAAGHLSSGEDYLRCAIRELDEELDLHPDQQNLLRIGAEGEHLAVGNEINTVYAYFKPAEVQITPNPVEVESVDWIGLQELREDYGKRKRAYYAGAISDICDNKEFFAKMVSLVENRINPLSGHERPKFQGSPYAVALVLASNNEPITIQEITEETKISDSTTTRDISVLKKGRFAIEDHARTYLVNPNLSPAKVTEMLNVLREEYIPGQIVQKFGNGEDKFIIARLKETGHFDAKSLLSALASDAKGMKEAVKKVIQKSTLEKFRKVVNEKVADDKKRAAITGLIDKRLEEVSRPSFRTRYIRQLNNSPEWKNNKFLIKPVVNSGKKVQPQKSPQRQIEKPGSLHIVSRYGAIEAIGRDEKKRVEISEIMDKRLKEIDRQVKKPEPLPVVKRDVKVTAMRDEYDQPILGRFIGGPVRWSDTTEKERIYMMNKLAQLCGKKPGELMVLDFRRDFPQLGHKPLISLLTWYMKERKLLNMEFTLKWVKKNVLKVEDLIDSRAIGIGQLKFYFSRGAMPIMSRVTKEAKLYMLERLARHLNKKVDELEPDDFYVPVPEFNNLDLSRMLSWAGLESGATGLGKNTVKELLINLEMIKPAVSIPVKSKLSKKVKKITVGSIPGVFNYLCGKNNITEASGGVTCQTIAGDEDIDRSPATIEYDLKGLYALKLIQRPAEDSQKSVKDARWFVPESIKKKQDQLTPILTQFIGKDLRPSIGLLNKVYEEDVKPILEPPAVTGKITKIKAVPNWWLSKKNMGGVLCPLFSGRRQGDQGIGDLKWLEYFIDFMSNQDADFMVQLPTTQINSTDPCPYVGISLFANNAAGYLPLDEFISAEDLSNYKEGFVKMAEEGLLGEAVAKDIRSRIDLAPSAKAIDYSVVIPYKEYCLRQEFEKIYAGIARGDNQEFNAYVEENKDWIEDYALFHCLLDHNGGKAWWQWDNRYKDRDAEALKAYSLENNKDILFYQYLQWLYYSRAQKVRAHAREKGKFIIGDAAIYPAPNSADVWANQDIFDMTKNAGAPSEPIAPDGQNWGTHPYRWDTKYDKVIKFWERRIRYMAQFYDGLRVDHLLGLCSEWLIDIGQHPDTGKFYPESPEEGAARGGQILRYLAKVAEEENILLVGEDIGPRPDVIRDMLDRLSLGLPNLYLYNPVGWRQKHMANRPHVMVVDATHDTPSTMAERYPGFNDGDRNQIKDFLRAHDIQPTSGSANDIEEQVISAMKKEGFYCLTLQTLLKERDAQINRPGTVGPHNWTWRSQDVESLLEMDNLGYFPKPSSGVKEDLTALPQEWRENEFKSADFISELSSLLQIENIIKEDKSTFIFSEKVTFDNGLGALLPKIARSGMRIAVIATNDRERALIDELNKGKPESERIIYADTIADIRTKIHTARYYYFKVTGDPDTDLQGVTTFDITEIVKKIIDALGKLSGIVERERLELLHEAAQKFSQAA